MAGVIVGLVLVFWAAMGMALAMSRKPLPGDTGKEGLGAGIFWTIVGAVGLVIALSS